MEYKLHEIAKLAGVSSRTLRYYDNIGLLPPLRLSEAGYRIYGPAQVNRLQEILLYREMGLELSTIARILSGDAYARTSALQAHLVSLQAQHNRIACMITTVEKSINETRGDITMTDTEKFEGFKRSLISQNEAQYGKEVRATYGDAAVDASNAKLMGMSEAQYHAYEELTAEILSLLRSALQNNAEPSSEDARIICEKHREWLMFFWKDYSPDVHVSLAQTYVADDRFRKYYDDQAGAGAAQFLYDALLLFTETIK